MPAARQWGDRGRSGADGLALTTRRVRGKTNQNTANTTTATPPAINAARRPATPHAAPQRLTDAPTEVVQP